MKSETTHAASRCTEQRVVGDIDPTERITVEGVEILRYTQGCNGTIFDHATGHGQPTRCVRCDRWTCLCPYCPRCIADDLGLANAENQALTRERQ